jgi:hypothetical protein
MALLVCYSSSPPADHGRNKAIYLDQEFYGLIFALCRSDRRPYAVLREMASLRYKSPVMVVSGERLDSLDEELAAFEASSGQKHRQIAEFRRVCANAKVEGCALTVSGDKYPEL